MTLGHEHIVDDDWSWQRVRVEGTRVILTGLLYEITFIQGREVARRHFLEGL